MPIFTFQFFYYKICTQSFSNYLFSILQGRRNEFSPGQSFRRWKKYNPYLFIRKSLWFKGPIFSEKYWYYFHCPKYVVRSILSFVFWIFPPLETAVQLESADSKQNAISKSLFQDSFWHIFWAMRKMHHTFWKKSNL